MIRLSFVSPNYFIISRSRFYYNLGFAILALMVSKVISAIPLGYNGHIIEVEGDSNKGLPHFNIVGMANKTIDESKERVRSAITNSDFSFPAKKVTINLAPAELNKDGAYLDLPIALSILILSRQLLPTDVENKLFVGELSLDGQIRPVRGIINILETAKENNIRTVYIPAKNLAQASLVENIEIIGVSNLKELFLCLKDIKAPSHVEEKSDSSQAGNRRREAGSASISSHTAATAPREDGSARERIPDEKISDFSTSATLLDHIRGQELAKRAITIAIAGHHNILISGPPGAGKTLLARAATNLLPPQSNTEKLAATKLHSIAGLSQEIVESRPFRSPHHTASQVSIIGGGKFASPGEISLAHTGVLFLDEFPEYPRSVLEALRQPLEDKTIAISRANAKLTYPADFMLIATMNPCPCGFLDSKDQECTCSAHHIAMYHKKLSGPLLDRIDMSIMVNKVNNSDLLRPVSNTSAEHEKAKQQIAKALQKQTKRYGKPDIFNSSLSSHEVSKKLSITEEAKKLLETASKSLNLSARAYFKTLKVARTIADLENREQIDIPSLSEALNYRKK